MALETGLIHGWRLISDSNDAVGAKNGADTSISHSSQGANFTTGGTSKIVIDDDNSFSFTNNIFSVAFLFKCSSASDSRALFLVKSDWGSAAYEWLIYNGDGAGNGKVRMQLITSAGSTIVNAYTNGSYLDGNWHQGLFVSDGSKVYIYVDGTEDTGGGVSLGAGSMSNTAAPLWLGMGSGLTGGYQGYMKDLYMWNTAKTAAEATQLFNGGQYLYYNGSSFVSPNASIFIPKIIMI